MSTTEITDAQKEVLRTLPSRFPVERIQRLWIFPAHRGKARETGFFVVSSEAEAEGARGLQALVTLRYQAETPNGKLQVEEEMSEEGWAPRDRIDRVIAGVISRAGEESGEPIEVELEGDPERWTELLERVGAMLDPASQ